MNVIELGMVADHIARSSVGDIEDGYNKPKPPKPKPKPKKGIGVVIGVATVLVAVFITAFILGGK